MADTSLIQFDALDAASTLANTDQTLLIQGSAGRRASLSQLRAHLVRPGHNVSISPDGVIDASSATWLHSSGAPSADTGANYDYNLATVTGSVYQKTLGAWNLIGSIKGTTGSSGTVSSNSGVTVGTTGNTLSIAPGATNSDPVVITRSGSGAIQFSHPVSLSSTLAIAGTTTAAAITASGTITGNGIGTGLVIANAATIGTTLTVGGTTTLLSTSTSPLTIANETVSSIVGVALTVPSGHEMALRVPNGYRLRVGVSGTVSALIVQPNTGLNTPGAASPNTVTVGNVLSAVAYQNPAATYDLTGKASVHAVSNLAMAWNTTGATYTGTTADALHQLAISADTADITPDAATGAGVLLVQHTVGGGSAKGGRVPFRVALTQAGAIGVRGDMLHAIGKFTSSWSYSQGGTDLTTGAAGSVHTLRPQITLNSGATNYAVVAAWGEAGLAIRSGASVRDARGIGVTLLAAHRTAASRSNIVFAIDGEAIAVDGVGATPTWTKGIAFGAPDRRWAMASTAELITADFQTNNGDGAARNAILPPPLATRGVALGNVNFSQQAGHSIHVPGASIDGTGQFRSANLFIKQVSGGIEIDIPLSKVSAVSVNTAGTGAAGIGNYYPNDILYAELTSGVRSQYRVTNTKVLNARIVAGGGSGTPGAVTVTGTTDTGTKFQATGIISAGGALVGNQVLSAAVAAGGTGGTPGAVTLTGTTGTGTKVQATGTINGSGVLTGALTVTVVGAYTVAPTNVAAEPVTGGGLTGATVSLVMVPTVTVAGSYTVNPTNSAVEPVTGGSLVGATVSLGIGLNTVSVLVPDVSAAAPGTITVSGGSGSGAVLTPTWAAANTLSLNTSGGLTEVVGTLAVGRSSGTSSILKLIGDGTADRVIEWYTGSARRALLRTPPETQVISATVVSGGSGGTNGAVTVTGTTGTGTKFQATGTISGGALTGALTITVQGSYSVLPTNRAVEPVTGGGLTGATVSLEFSQRFQARMYNQSGSAPETMLDLRRNLGTLADPHMAYFGPDLAVGTEALHLEVRGDVKARSFTTFATHYPAMTLANTANEVPALAAFKSSYSGTTTTTGYYIGMGSTGDSVALMTGGSLDYLNINGVLTAGYNGGRTGIDALISELGDTQQLNDSRGSIGGKFSHNASNNVGGIVEGFGVSNFGWGNIYSANLQSTLNAGATWRRSLVGMEIDLMAVAGTSFVNGHGLLITTIQQHAVQPARDWSAITISNASTLDVPDRYAGRFKTIFSVGDYGSAFPGHSDGVLMRLTGGEDYVSGPAILRKGFDFREAAFTGQIIQWDGGELLQNTYGGELQVGYAALTATSTGASLNVNRFKTATVAFGTTAGTGYGPGALVKTAGDVYVKITSVITRTITGITVANPPIVTSPGHGLANGTVFDISDVSGMTQANQQTVASVTKANPGVFTKTGHGLPKGARVRLSGFGDLIAKTSMYQLSGNPYYVVANRTDNTFTLTYVSGVAVDTTHFQTYNGAGTITISYRVGNATANTFELQTEQGGAINASGWTAYVSAGLITTTIPDEIELFRPAWTASSASETNVATENLVRSGRRYGSGLTVNLTKTGVSALAIQGSGGATTVGGTLAVTGAVTLSSTLAVTGAATLSSTLGVTGAATAASLIVTGSTVPATTGIYQPSAGTLGMAVSGAGEVQLTSAALSPMVSGGSALGTTALMWGGVCLADGATINFAAGNLTLTHSTGALTNSGLLASASFVPTGSTVPVNGMYLSSGNTVALAANTTQILTDTSTVIAVKPTTASTSSTTGALTVAGGLGVAGTVYAGSSLRSDGAVFGYYGTDNQVHLGSSSIEIGLTGRVGTSSPFIDFHSSANSPDYDARILVAGGSATSGSAAMTIISSSLVVAGPTGGVGGLLTINTNSNGSSGASVPSGIIISDSSSGSTWDNINPWGFLQWTSASAIPLFFLL